MDGNLYEIIRGRKHYLNPQLIKGYMWQLMKSLDHMHKKGIFHRDIKPENILTDNGCEVGYGLKLADFGSCRGIYSKQPYTEYISTRWYRAPECLLTDGYYGPEMDMWGAGCVMFEITTLFPLFPGKDETDQIARIHKIIGTKPESIAKLKGKGASHINFDFPHEKGTGIVEHLQHCAPEAVDLLLRLLKYDAAERITARDAMRHPYFKEMREFETRKQAAIQSTAQGTSGTGAVDSSPSHQQPQPPKQKHVSPDHSHSNSHTSQQLQQQQQQQMQQQQHLQQQQQMKQQNKQVNLVPIQGQGGGGGGGHNKGLPNIVYCNEHSNNQSNSNQHQPNSKSNSNANASNTKSKHSHHNTGPSAINMNNSNNTNNSNSIGNSHHMSNNSGIVGVNTSTTGSTNISSLPPILGGGGGSTHKTKISNTNGNTNGNGSNGNSNGTQKRRKKYRLNYANQVRITVLREFVVYIYVYVYLYVYDAFKL